MWWGSRNPFEVRRREEEKRGREDERAYGAWDSMHAVEERFAVGYGRVVFRSVELGLVGGQGTAEARKWGA